MATELGSAFISVGLGTNTLAGDIKKAFGAAEGSGSEAGKSAGKGFSLGFAGVAAAAVGALGIGSFFKGAISGAGDLEQSVGAIGTVFKGSAGQMNKWADQAATSVGLSKNEFNELGTLIGSQLKNGGTAMDELGPKTNQLISLGADLSSMFGGSTKDAVDALSSALKGERDPIEKYGVSLNQAKIDAEAAALGFTKVGGSLSAEANQAATLSLIMKQTADAHGNFGKETDTLAHKQQVLNAQWANGKARIGTELLPAAAAFTGLLSKALGPAINATVTGIKTVTGGFTAFSAAFKAADGDVTSSGFAGVMERIGFVASQVFPVIKSVFGSIAAAVGPLIGKLLPLAAAFSPMQIIFAAIQPLLPQLVAVFGQLASVIGTTLLSTLTTLTPMFVQLSAVVSQALGGVLAAILPAVVMMITMLGATLAQLLPIITPIIATVVALATSLLTQLMPIITSLVTAILPPLVDIFGNILTAIGPVISMVAGLLIPVIQALMPVVVTVFGVVADVVKSAMQIVQGVIQVVTGVISGNWSQVWSGIQNIFSGIWNTIVAVVRGALQIVGQVVISGLSMAASAVGSILGSIGNFFASTWSSVTRGVSGFVDGFVGFFRGLPGQVIAALSGLAGQMIGVGQNIVQGLIDGARGMINNAVQAVKDVGGSMLAGIKGFLGIHSPSREFMKIGGWVTVGLAEGVKKKAPAAVKAIQGVAQKLTDAATAHWRKAGSLTGKKNAAARAFETSQARELDSASSAIRKQLGMIAWWARQRDALAVKLAASQKKLNDAITVRNKQATESAGKLRDEFNLGDMVGLNAASIKQLADNTAKQLKGFAAKIGKLRGLGLNAQLIQQIGDLGSKDGGALADSLILGGKSAVSGLNSSFKTIGTYASQAGNQIADGMYGAGINGLKGLVSGFSGNLKAVDQAAKKVASRLTSQVKKNLGIHSPSRVFRTEVGQQVGEGARLGILDKVKAVAAAGEQLVRVPGVPAFESASYGASSGARGNGFANYGTIHVRDENEMARIITTKQRDAQVAYGF